MAAKPPLLKQPRPKFFEMPTGASKLGWHQIEGFVYCPRQYLLSNVRNIVPFQTTLRPGLSEGILHHAARAQWLYDNRDLDSPWQDAVVLYAKKVETEEKVKLSADAVKHVLRDFAGYVNYWKTRPTSQVLAVEYAVSPRGLTSNAPVWMHRTARLDSIERFMGETWLGELKSTRGSAGEVGNMYRLHGQPLMQLCLYGEEETKRFGPLAGVLLDPLLKGDDKQPGTGAKRIPIRVSEIQPAMERFRKDLKGWVMNSQSIEYDDHVEGRPTSCMRPYGPCDYRDLCAAGRNGSSRYVFRDGTSILKWKPEEGKTVPPWA